MILGKFQLQDSRNLAEYLSHLCPETKKRFGPHSFDEQTIADLYQSSPDLLGYLAIDPDTTYIEAYAIVKTGTLEHDRSRLESYGLILDNGADCTLAPSVSDAWQGKGLGTEMLKYILSDLQQAGIQRIFLWGGVQASNQKAVRYYEKNAFRILGTFDHHGVNYDMIRDLICPQPTTHNSQLTTHNSQPTTHNSQLTTHNSQPTTHNPQLTTNNPQPPTTNNHPPSP